MAKRKTNTRKATTKKQRAKRSAGPSKAEMKAFMAAILGETEVTEIEDTKGKSQGRRGGL